MAKPSRRRFSEVRSRPPPFITREGGVDWRQSGAGGRFFRPSRLVLLPRTIGPTGRNPVLDWALAKAARRFVPRPVRAVGRLASVWTSPSSPQNMRMEWRPKGVWQRDVLLDQATYRSSMLIGRAEKVCRQRQLRRAVMFALGVGGKKWGSGGGPKMKDSYRDMSSEYTCLR